MRPVPPTPPLLGREAQGSFQTALHLCHGLVPQTTGQPAKQRIFQNHCEEMLPSLSLGVYKVSLCTAMGGDFQAKHTLLHTITKVPKT